jgi:hypothetical protein
LKAGLKPVALLGIGPPRQPSRLASRIYALDHLTQRGAGHRLALDITGEHVIAAPLLAHAFDQRDRRSSEWSAELAEAFHATRWNNPCVADCLAPLGAAGLGGAHRSQDDKFEAPGCNTFLLAQFGHERADLFERQRRLRPLRFDLADLGAGRSNALMLSAQRAGFFTLAEALDLGPGEHAFDARA